MLYHYLASDNAGKITEGEFDADTVDQVLQYLGGKELQPIDVRPAKKERTLFQSRGRIVLTDKIFLTKYLSLMLRVGTDLLSAINILIVDFDKPAMKDLLLEIRENLSRGRPFYQAFARHPKIFSTVFINLVKAGEASGNLLETFQDLSVSLEQEAELRNRIRSAITYPIILLGASFLIFLFLITFALPRIAKVFLEGGIDPPGFSRVVFGVGLFVSDHLLALFGILLIVLGPGVYFLAKTVSGRRLFHRALSRTPLIRNIYRELAVQRFAATFSSLIKAGLPVIQATQITAEIVSAEEFRVSLLRVANEGLAKGLTLGEAFRRETVFPRVVTNLIAISEKAGHLDEVLHTVANFYESNVDANVRSLVSFLEPVLLLGMGMLVATIALAIVVPIYQLTAQF